MSSAAVVTGTLRVKHLDRQPCPKILYTKVSDKLAYADSADPDQTAPKGVFWSGFTLFTIPVVVVF